MTDIKTYSWWGFDGNTPPEHLKTKKQLSRMGKRSGNPVGVIQTPKYNCYLYDPEICPNKKPLTENQKAAIAARKQKKIENEQAEQRYCIIKSIDRCLSYLPDWLSELQSELTHPDLEWRNYIVPQTCKRITRFAKETVELLHELYPVPQPEPGSAVLGGQRQPRQYDVVLGGQERKDISPQV